MSEVQSNPFLELKSTVMTMIKGALEVSPGMRRENFDRLIRYYRSPLIHHLTVQCRVPIDEADDIVQSFLVDKFLAPQPEQNLVAAYFKACEKKSSNGEAMANIEAAKHGNPLTKESSDSVRRIRFRFFLRKALRNYLVDCYRKSKQNSKALRLEEFDVEDDAGTNADAEFDQVWARNLFRMAINTVREECEAEGLNDVWFVFSERSLRPLETGEVAPSFDELCESGRFSTSKDASNRYETARRKVRAALRRHIVEYLPSTSTEQIEEELLSLKEVLLETARNSGEVNALCDVESLYHIFRQDDDDRILQLWTNIICLPLDHAVALLRSTSPPVRNGIDNDESLTIQQLIDGSQTPLSALKWLKDQAKQVGTEQRGEDAKHRMLISQVLYALAIAQAELSYGVEISSRRGNDAKVKFRAILDFDWVDEATKSLIRRWLGSKTTE